MYARLRRYFSLVNKFGKISKGDSMKKSITTIGVRVVVIFVFMMLPVLDSIAKSSQAADALIHITAGSDFKEKILESDKICLVDFYAVWCPPCKKLAPIIQEIADKSKGKFVVAKVDTGELKKLAGKYKVKSIPTVILFKNGKEVERIVGLRSKKDYMSAINTVLKKQK
jgi:thioredoxin 1